MTANELIDREFELASLDALLADVGGGFAAVEIAGGAGIGKTSLWSQSRRMAEARGFTVLWSRPTETTTKSSFSAVADLLFPADPALLRGLPPPQRAALEVALLHRSGRRTPALHRAVAAGLLGLVRELARSSPVLIAVDDWQWLDRPSRDALEFTAQRLEHEPVRIVYTLRTPAAAGGLAGAVTDGRISRLQLKGLPLASIARLLSDRLGMTLPRPLLVRISDSTAGNPFHALELARALIDAGSRLTPGGALPVPENLRELLLARVDRLPRASREMLALVAVLARPTVEAVDAVALARAENAGIVLVEPTGEVRFSHPLLATAVQSSLSSAQRRATHAQAARIVKDPEQRAHHLALAAAGPDAEVAADLDRATLLAEVRGAPDAAAELAELAATLTPLEQPSKQAERMARAASLLLYAGDLERAERLLDAALELQTADAARARSLQLAGQLAGRRHHWPAAVELARSAVLLAAGQPRLQATIECDLAFASVSAGDFPEAVVHAQAAVKHAAAVGDTGVEAIALGVATMVSFLSGQGVDAESLKRAVDLEDPRLADGLMMRPRFIAGLLELWRGDAASSAQTLVRLRQDLIDRGQEGVAPMACVFIAWAYLWSGDFPAAERIAREAQDAAALLDDVGVSAIAQTASALVNAHIGRTTPARAEAAEALALFSRLQWTSALIWPSWALGLAALCDDDPEGADAALGPPAEQLAAMGAGDPVLGVFLADEAAALTALGREDDAERLLSWFEARATALDVSWALALVARCRGELAMRAGDPDGADAAFAAALAAHDRCPIPFERARTLLASGRCLRRARHRRAAIEALSQAESAFRSLGATGWAAQAKRELERVGHRSNDRDRLSVSERRIAELAASGLSNREIAERAFVSVKTVEANLTRAYRKLGVRSRVGLAQALQG